MSKKKKPVINVRIQYPISNIFIDPTLNSVSNDPSSSSSCFLKEA